MRLFRRSLDLNYAATREATPDDLGAISRLLRTSTHHYTSYPAPHLPTLLAGAPALVLTTSGDVLGAAVAGWSVDSTSWLRVLAVGEGLLIGPALDALLPPFHALLRARAVRQLFYAGDEASDTWIQPALASRGYVRETDVVVYEKAALDVPSRGNQQVRIRAAQSVDLPAIQAIDRACFAAQWHKDESVLGAAIFEVAYFVVAEQAGRLLGYAFATSHFGGRLVHLVRIAARPEVQGQAIGVRLLAEVVEFARACGANTLTLNTQAHNTRAQRLYEWFGFRRTGEQQTVLRYDL
ncbi:MAG TPA: GNAT family N-acetyltransferase [Kouleothrix sp.]|uniref:GNAT family N-acetyltransferase n=1 Tax=Kouleothrix sp. TaxID=2779161 RepID=UPI002B5A5F43|nr:GNAT family N-acetyltransferase [Kouleothrix sp.]HRC76870.1 GNAT family N-acetyltransferase [Kouleothrix sp.]